MAIYEKSFRNGITIFLLFGTVNIEAVFFLYSNQGYITSISVIFM